MSDSRNKRTENDADYKLANRRMLRFAGRQIEADRQGSDTQLQILSGPELVTPTTKMQKRSKRSQGTRTRLLDTAELLFAKWGYTGVSVRDVTDMCDTRLGAISYYFGSKQHLYLAVMQRRSKELCAMRMITLRETIASDLKGTVFVEALLDAFITPAFDLYKSDQNGWGNFFQLIGHTTFSRLWPRQIEPDFNQPAELFIEGLQQRYPHVSQARLQAIALLIVGPLVYIIARTGRVETFSNPALDSNDLDGLFPFMRSFLYGGICANLGVSARSI